MTVKEEFSIRLHLTTYTCPHVHLGAFSTGLIPERVEGEEGEGTPRRGWQHLLRLFVYWVASWLNL